VFAKTALFAGYVLVYERFALFAIDPASVGAWLGAFLGVDFLYYWFHRASHEVNFLWAAHIVHHQSEEYNLSVALRQSAIQQFFSAPFYLPLALIGIPPKLFLAADAADTLYQFWIHTRTVGKLGFLESFLNTPSHHRVHHGSDEKYIDRNHAGTLIVWDKLFGTFQTEEEEPAYGVTRPLATWNPLWANVHYFAELGRVARRTRRWRDKVRIFLKPPGWRPADVPFEPVPYTPTQGLKYDATPPEALRAYAVSQFLLGLGAAIALLFFESRLSGIESVAIALFAIWSLLDVGGLFDRGAWVFPAEVARWSTATIAAALLVPSPANALAAAAVALVGALAVAHLRSRRSAFHPRTTGEPLPIRSA